MSHLLSQNQKIALINRAFQLALVDIEMPYARPFGALVAYDGKVVAEAFNTAVRTNDPTAHAEVK